MTAVTLGVVLSRIEVLSLKRFTTVKSGLLSPLMSPMLTETGPPPVGKVTWVAKVGVVALVAVVLSRMEAVLSLMFVTAKSAFSSPLMSPMLTQMGPVPVAKVTWGAKVGAAAPAAVVLSRMETVLLVAFATAKSGLASPLMSPRLTQKGLVPVAKVTWGAKVGLAAPAVVLSRMEAVLLLPSFVTAKSSKPSPLMSPMLTDLGAGPVVKSSLVAKVGVAAPAAVVLSRMEAVLLLK